MATTISLNFEKYQKKDVTRALENHYGKKRGERNHSNKEIDVSQSWRNIIFVECEGGLRQKALARIAEEKERNPKLRVRKDSNIMITASVNIGGDLGNASEDEKLEFLNEAYTYLVDRFGGKDGENILSAEIHMDETEPHLHVSFVPIFEIDGRSRLTTDPVMKTNNLRNEHVEIRNHMNAIADGRWKCAKKEKAGPSGLSLNELKTFTAVVEEEVKEKTAERSRQLQRREMNVTVREKVAEDSTKKADKANEEAKARVESVNQRTRELNEHVARVNAFASELKEKEKKQDEREKEQDEKERQLQEKEIDLERRETLLERAQSVLNDLMQSTRVFTQKFLNTFKGALKRKSQHEMQKVMDVGSQFAEKVVNPTERVIEQTPINPETIIDDLKQPTIDANELISGLGDENQPSALQR